MAMLLQSCLINLYNKKIELMIQIINCIKKLIKFGLKIEFKLKKKKLKKTLILN